MVCTMIWNDPSCWESKSGRAGAWRLGAQFEEGYSYCRHRRTSLSRCTSLRPSHMHAVAYWSRKACHNAVQLLWPHTP